MLWETERPLALKRMRRPDNLACNFFAISTTLSRLKSTVQIIWKEHRCILGTNSKTLLNTGTSPHVSYTQIQHHNFRTYFEWSALRTASQNQSFSDRLEGAGGGGEGSGPALHFKVHHQRVCGGATRPTAAMTHIRRSVSTLRRIDSRYAEQHRLALGPAWHPLRSHVLCVTNRLLRKTNGPID